MPVDSPFLNMAGRVIDPAFEAAASVNFWVMQSLYIPFEITAVNGMIHFGVMIIPQQSLLYSNCHICCN